MPSRFGDGRRTWRPYGAALVVLSAVGLVIAVTVAQLAIAPLTATAVPAGTAFFDAATAPAAADWPTYGGGYGAQRYSDLDQITPANVAKLKRAWVYCTGDIPKQFGNELTPIKIGGSLYGCSNRHKIFALDASSGSRGGCTTRRHRPSSRRPIRHAAASRTTRIRTRQAGQPAPNASSSER